MNPSPARGGTHYNLRAYWSRPGASTIARQPSSDHFPPSPERSGLALGLALLAVVVVVSLGVIGAALALAAPPGDASAVRIEPATRGDPAAGRDYLLNGDYIGAGIPLVLWRQIARPVPPELRTLERNGIDPSVPDDLNQYFTPDGVEVVSGVNCLACHSSRFRGELVIGMGNSLRDWPPTPSTSPALRALASLGFAKDSPERRTLDVFLRGADALDGKVSTPFRGLNPAFRFEEVAAANRNPADLSWSGTPVYQYPETGAWSDVPAWWNVRKKTALYYNAMGHGDFARLIQQIGIVMMGDAKDAERTLPRMRDILAYIDTLRAPVHPGPIDSQRAARGAEIFAARCTDCHGTYDADESRETFPNRRIPVDEVGTDPTYARRVKESGIHEWFNKSWFAQGGSTYADPQLAYIAPPLDGVWATAPYFHNGSVPTLEGVLNSRARPERWRRSFRDDDYDLDSPGWKYREIPPESPEAGREVYDTRVPGCGNAGHTYADDLSEQQRRDLIEYLKSL